MTTSIDDIEIVNQFPTHDEAEQETAKSRAKTVDQAKHVLMLRRRGAHLAMGYGTWTQYVKEEFGRSYRWSKYLINFALLLESIEERTGVENPPLIEKYLRDAKPEDVDTIVDAANSAKENGQDPREAMKDGQQVVKEKEKAKRKPRTKGDGTAKKPAKPSAPEEPTREETDDRPSINELTADDVETAPEHEAPAKPTALPVKLPPFTYELWTIFTLACRDEIDATRMRSDFDRLMETVDINIHAQDDAEQRMSA